MNNRAKPPAPPRSAIRRAFTLLELLLVVGIVAILAVVAVPNFLEAQVRSKVSRVHADQRQIVTAIMAYTADNKALPPDADDVGEFDAVPDAQIEWFPLLTTPVAYMPAILMDPFHDDGHSPDARTDALFPGAPPHPYAYLTAGSFYPDPFREDLSIHGGRPTEYVLVSLGPNRLLDFYRERGVDDVYEATNGTLSAGDIIQRAP